MFFAGDSAGHCIPLSGEGIRTAFYFGIAAGREIARRLDGTQTNEQALTRYAAFSARHAPAYGLALALQHAIPRLPPRVLTQLLQLMGRERPCRRAFDWYLTLAPPDLRDLDFKNSHTAPESTSEQSSALVFHAVPGFDALTGLPDRAAFVAELRAAAAAADGVAVLFLDLDDFKVVNDGFGHEAGDRLLIQVAQRLQGAVHDGDMVARLGGDEFTVLCVGAPTRRARRSPPGASAARSSAPFDVAGQRRHVRVSIGCRVAGAGETDPEALLRDADSAMYQAKGTARTASSCSPTRPAPASCAGSSSSRCCAPRSSTARCDVHYQPQIDLTTGRLVRRRGARALERGRRPPSSSRSPRRPG